MPTMGQGAIENGGLGGTYETTQSTTIQPYAGPAAHAQAETQAQITADYTKLIQQALDMYNPAESTTTTNTTYTPDHSKENYSDWYKGYLEWFNHGEGSDRRLLYTRAPYTPDQYYERYHKSPWADPNKQIGTDHTTTTDTGSAFGTALQGSLDSLGQMSNDDAYNALLIGAGANNGTDLIDRSTFQPYMDAGTNAANEWQALAGVGENPYTAQQIQDRYLNTAGVRAQMNQGNQAVNANYGAKGLTGSSALMKALTKFGQDIASQNIGAAQQQLYQMAGLGAQAANSYASQLNQNYATNVDAQLKNQQLAQNAANSRGTLANAALNNQTSLLNSLGGNTSSLATQAAIERMKTIAGAQQDTNSVKINAPILETSAQTVSGWGHQAAGTLAGVGMMALLGI